jgi:hypothetical protein
MRWSRIPTIVGVLNGALTFVLAFALGCDSTPALDPDVEATLVAHLETAGEPPDAFLLGMFEDHDVVLLGEYGRIIEDVTFVSRLVPQLAASGVSAIGVSFLCSDDQGEIDSMLTRVTYDELAMTRLQGRFDGGTWPYREYRDIAKAVWNVNRDRAPGTPPFRLLALSTYVDWAAFHGDDRPKAQLEQRKLAGIDHVAAAIVENEVLGRGEKALLFVGRNEAFTRFSRPIVRGGSVTRRAASMGTLLEEKAGDRVATVLLHAPFPTESGLVSPFNGAIEAAFVAHGDSVGFRVRAPFAALSETRSTYAAGESVTLASLCDGYILLKPLAKLNGVSLIPSLLPANDEAFEAAKMRLPNRAQAMTMDTARDYRAHFQREAAIGGRFTQIE